MNAINERQPWSGRALLRDEKEARAVARALALAKFESSCQCEPPEYDEGGPIYGGYTCERCQQTNANAKKYDPDGWHERLFDRLADWFYRYRIVQS